MELVRWGGLAIGVGIAALARPFWVYLLDSVLMVYNRPSDAGERYRESDGLYVRLAGFFLVCIGLLVMLYGAVI